MTDGSQRALATAFRRLGDGDLAGAVEYLAESGNAGPIREVDEWLLRTAGVGRGEAVLDVGCGLGRLLQVAGRMTGPSGYVCGVDSSWQLLGRTDGVPAVAASAAALPFGDATFDLVIAQRLFMHLERPVESLREMARVCKPDGRVVVAELTFAVRGAEAPHGDVMERLTGRLHDESERTNWVGSYLPAFFIKAGFDETAVTQHTALSRDPADVRRVLGLSNIPPEVQAWWQSLTGDFASGRQWLQVTATAFTASMARRAPC